MLPLSSLQSPVLFAPRAPVRLGANWQGGLETAFQKLKRREADVASLRSTHFCRSTSTSPSRSKRKLRRPKNARLRRAVQPPPLADQPTSASAASRFAATDARISRHTRTTLARRAEPSGRTTADGKRPAIQLQVRCRCLSSPSRSFD